MTSKPCYFFYALVFAQLVLICSAEENLMRDAQVDCTLTISVYPPNAGVTFPSTGTHTYPFNTSVYVSLLHGPYSTPGHWELNGTNVSSEAFVTVLMNANYNLTCIFNVIEPFKIISISPPKATVELGSSVSFLANVTGGLEPYSFQWYVNDIRVAMGPNEKWNFTPAEEGGYRVFFKAKDIWSSVVDWKQSDTAIVTVENAVPEFSFVTTPLLLVMLISSIYIIQRKINRSIS